jgi:hypothetical protein
MKSREQLTEELFWAIGENDLEKAKHLIIQGADVNQQDAYGETQLHRASSMHYKTKKLKLLLKAGADVNVQNKESETPLHKAISSNNQELMKLLLKAGADVNVQNKKGETPLHLTVLMLNKERAGLLLEAGADVNVQDKSGNVPLYIAAKCNEGEIVQCLLIAGADTEKVDISKIKNTSIVRTIKIAKFIQNLCKLQGDKNTAKLGNITNEEYEIATKFMIGYLNKHGVELGLDAHIQNFAPKNLTKLSQYVKKYINEYTQKLQNLEVLLFKEEHKVAPKPHQSKKLGVYLSEKMEKKTGDISELNQLMFKNHDIAKLVIYLSKKIVFKGLNEVVLKYLKGFEGGVHKYQKGSEEYTDIVEALTSINSKDDLPIETEKLGNAEEPAKALGTVEGSETEKLGDIDDLYTDHLPH